MVWKYSLLAIKIEMAEFLFLGTGGSTGIPKIGCKCPVCKSTDPHNKRLRPSGLLTVKGKKLLIDAGPDFREQALKYEIDTLDALLLTHTHFDHVAGLDELRVYYLLTRKSLPVLVSEETKQNLQRRYDYLFREKRWGVSLTAQFDFHVLEGDRGEMTFVDIPLFYMTYEQGGMRVNGYRFGPFAYISDIRHYPETIFEDLKGLDHLVLGAVRNEPSNMHFNIEEAVAFAQKTGAKNAYFTHIGHEIEHVQTNATLPPGISLAYDGLRVEFNL